MTVTDGHSTHDSCSIATRSAGVNNAFLLMFDPTATTTPSYSSAARPITSR